MNYRFVIVDDHPLFRGALRLALSAPRNDVEIVEAGDLETAKALIQDASDIDLVLLDLSLNGVGWLTGFVALRDLQSALPIAIVSATDDPTTIRAALALGASGFISKSSSPEVIKEAVQTILDGGVWSPLGDDQEEMLDPDMIELIRCLRKLTPQPTYLEIAFLSWLTVMPGCKVRRPCYGRPVSNEYRGLNAFELRWAARQ